MALLIKGVENQRSCASMALYLYKGGENRERYFRHRSKKALPWSIGTLKVGKE